MKLSKLTLTILITSFLTACGGSSSGDGEKLVNTTSNDPALGYQTAAGVEACSTEDIMGRVDYDMRDYYIYYDQVPTLNFSDFDSPEELMRNLRVDPDIYSSVYDAEQRTNLTENSRTDNFGLTLKAASDKQLRVRDVVRGSPAHKAGVLRGDQLLAINGVAAKDFSNAFIGDALDPNNSPIALTLQTGDDESRFILIDSAEYKIETATLNRRFVRTDGSQIVAYLSIGTFLRTTVDEIKGSLTSLSNEGGFDELIVDLRYNGGGLSSAARYFASVVGGAAVANKPYTISTWNDKYSDNNGITYFDDLQKTIGLPRVFVLVTGRTASASEAFINALKPYIEVVVIGSTTKGKPFTSSPIVYCDKSLSVMRSVRTNALGIDVGQGIEPDCQVSDDWQSVTNSIKDPLTSGALRYIINETCPSNRAAEASHRGSLESELSYSAQELILPSE